MRIAQGTRSGLWLTIAEGLRVLRPKLVVLENVAALRRRGLDRVLGDLAALGYDASWTSLRASDVGAAHRRERLFVFAYEPSSREWAKALTDANEQRRARRAAGQQTEGEPPRSRPVRRRDDLVSLTAEREPAQVAADTASQRRDEGFTTSAREQWQPDVAVGSPATVRTPARRGSGAADWGPYAAALEQWSRVVGRRAPSPTELGTRGQARLSPRFSEWLMGIEDGFVTDLGLPYTAQMRMLGNGVVPQQAEAALRCLVSQRTTNHFASRHERGNGVSTN